MKYFIGLDGGGTKTKCVITDSELTPLYQCQGGPSNFLFYGTEKVSETLFSLITECLNQKNISSDQIASILIGTAGAGRKDDANKLKEDFLSHAKSKGYSFNNFNVESDAQIAHEGAFSGNAGMLLIAGTGSIIFGKDSQGEMYKVGGYGRLIGDEGSGSTIGKRGLNQAAKALDGRCKKTLLSEFLQRDFNIANTSQLVTEVYRNNFDVASFAPKVIEAASIGDKAANKILDEEADELVLHVKTMYKIIGQENFNLCLVGGTIATDNFYSQLFRNKLQHALPQIKIIEAENPPEIGAVILAKQLLNSRSY